MHTLKLLLTGAGAPGTRGALYALHHNPDGIRIRTVGTDLQADVLARHWLDAFFQVPAPEEASYVEALLALCERESVDLVIPQTTRELFVFARHKEAFAAQGTPVMVSSLPAIECANHKGELLQIAQALQFPCPAFVRTRSRRELLDAARQLGYPAKPVVVKPPVANGGRGFRVLRAEAWDLARFLAEKPSGEEIPLGALLAILERGESWPELLVTEYLPGSEYSVDLFLGARVQVAVPRLRKAIRSGISFANELEYREDLMQYAVALGQRIGLQYAVGFQFKLDQDGEPKLLECNPRLQGTMVASLFGGANVIWLGVKEALGEVVDWIPPLRPASFERFWGGIGFAGEQVDEI
ncbi:MAG TPA: ATP-grasp domain-containing protein [Symbiobacteriaceae bacterium]|nr:ATP-grasp domain-containing protein [Symbiobacteriaceae bacterium]